MPRTIGPRLGPQRPHPLCPENDTRPQPAANASGWLAFPDNLPYPGIIDSRNPLMLQPTLVRGALGACLAALALAGCAMPSAGPAPEAIAAGATATVALPEGVRRHEFVFTDAAVAVQLGLAARPTETLQGTFGTGARGRGPANIRLAIGDIVQATVFESTKGGLFIPEDAGARPGNFVTLPQQIIDRSGTIKIPYAGQVPAAGRSLRDVQQDVERRLSQKAIEPQVVLSLVNQRGSEISVLGDVPAGNKFPVSPGGDRVLDAIARAGGIRSPGYETFVTVQRGGRSARVFFERLVRDVGENIFVQPGDTVYVTREARYFTVLGAAGQNGRFNFESERVTLAETLGRAAGLIDSRASPSHIYLFRLEDRHTLTRLGVDVSAFPSDQRLIGTIYRADLRDPASVFVTQQFQVHDKDVIYVGNADSVEVLKVFNAAASVIAPFGAAANAGFNVRRLVQ